MSFGSYLLDSLKNKRIIFPSLYVIKNTVGTYKVRCAYCKNK